MPVRSKAGPLVLLLVILGLVTYLLLPPAHQTPPEDYRNRKAIEENLRVIALHADKYAIEKGLGTSAYKFTYQDLMEIYPGELSAIETIDGENYSDLSFNEDTNLLEVETRSGETISYSW